MQIVTVLTKQEVNMGDHAESVVCAVEVYPSETVKDLVARTLVSRAASWGAPLDEENDPLKWHSEPKWFLTIRIAATPSKLSDLQVRGG